MVRYEISCSKLVSSPQACAVPYISTSINKVAETTVTWDSSFVAEGSEGALRHHVCSGDSGGFHLRYLQAQEGEQIIVSRHRESLRLFTCWWHLEQREVSKHDDEANVEASSAWSR